MARRESQELISPCHRMLEQMFGDRLHRRGGHHAVRHECLEASAKFRRMGEVALRPIRADRGVSLDLPRGIGLPQGIHRVARQELGHRRVLHVLEYRTNPNACQCFCAVCRQCRIVSASFT